MLGEPIGGRRVGKLLGVAELLQIVREDSREAGLPRTFGASTLSTGDSKGS